MGQRFKFILSILEVSALNWLVRVKFYSLSMEQQCYGHQSAEGVKQIPLLVSGNSDFKLFRFSQSGLICMHQLSVTQQFETIFS